MNHQQKGCFTEATKLARTNPKFARFFEKITGNAKAESQYVGVLCYVDSKCDIYVVTDVVHLISVYCLSNDVYDLLDCFFSF